MFVSVRERQRAILEDRCHHTVVWKRYSRKLTFRACRPPPDFMLAGMCATWLHSRAITGSRFVGITPWPGSEREKAYVVL